MMATTLSNAADPADKVIAVIVTFEPDIDLLRRNCEAVVSQADEVVIVDNSVRSQDSVKQIADQDHRTLYISNGGNRGIAHALNRGLDYAREKGATWLLTMDQDSELPEGYCNQLLAFVNDLPASPIVASVAADYDSAGNAETAVERDIDVPYLISSGNLVRVTALTEVGGFREDLFIDYVDLDISFKLRRAGYRVVRCPGLSFLHSLGAPSVRQVAGARVIVTNHSAFRRYFITRNALVFMANYAVFDPSFVARHAWILLKDTTKIFVLERNRGNKLKAILWGVLDALIGRRGPTAHRF